PAERVPLSATGRSQRRDGARLGKLFERVWGDQDLAAVLRCCCERASRNPSSGTSPVAPAPIPSRPGTAPRCRPSLALFREIGCDRVPPECARAVWHTTRALRSGGRKPSRTRTGSDPTGRPIRSPSVEPWPSLDLTARQDGLIFGVLRTRGAGVVRK